MLKTCKKQFTPARDGQFVCSYECAMKYTALNTAEANYRANVGSKKELKEKLKSWSDYYNEALEVFNEYIRLRDKDKPCISCNAPAGTYTMSSGHFHPQGSYKGIAMHEDNAHGQCWYNCNKNKHGNLTEYRPRLIERIGLERVEEIDRLRNTTIKPSIPELIELKVIYKDKIKQLKRSK